MHSHASGLAWTDAHASSFWTFARRRTGTTRAAYWKHCYHLILNVWRIYRRRAYRRVTRRAAGMVACRSYLPGACGASPPPSPACLQTSERSLACYGNATTATSAFQHTYARLFLVSRLYDFELNVPKHSRVGNIAALCGSWIRMRPLATRLISAHVHYAWTTPLHTNRGVSCGMDEDSSWYGISFISWP